MSRIPGGAGRKEPACSAGDVRYTGVPSRGRGDPPEEGKAAHSSTLAWRIPATEEPGGLQRMGSQTAGHE